MTENEVETKLTCEQCGQSIDDDMCSHEVMEQQNLPTIEICDDCFVDYFCCDVCGDYFHDDNITYVDCIEDYICNECLRLNFNVCGSCGELYHIDDLVDGYCESCFISGENSFDFTFFSTNKESKINGNILYYGIELEVGSTEYGVNWRSMLRDYNSIVHLASDCSIYNNSDIHSEVELVANPATYNWFIDNRNIWSNLLKVLRKNGVWSYKAKSCGIHIHMSKNVFTTLHLYKFLKMIYSHSDFTYFVSQRGTEGELERWANINNESSDETIRRKANKKHSYEKYTAVNLIHPDTVEVRIFRGTLNESSFYKNIEYLQALFEFTKSNKHENLTVENYIKYVSIYKDRFSGLYNWLEKRGKLENKNA